MTFSKRTGIETCCVHFVGYKGADSESDSDNKNKTASFSSQEKSRHVLVAALHSGLLRLPLVEVFVAVSFAVDSL